jgi:hypothetical protein
MPTVDIITRALYETIYIEHFVNYHLSLGISHIYILFEDTVGQPKLPIDNPNVTIVKHNYRGNDSLIHATKLIPTVKSDWVLVIDADEYLYLKSHTNIASFLKTVPPHINQVAFQWAMVENFQSMTAKSDLFNILCTHKLYSNPHVKSMYRSSIYAKSSIEHAHLTRDVPITWLWDKEVKTNTLQQFSPEQYISSMYPFLIHFHTRSIQNIFIKCITSGLKNKACSSETLNKLINENDVNGILRLLKFTLPFLHSNNSVIPYEPLLSAGDVYFDQEIEQLKLICYKYSINYTKLEDIIVQIDKLHKQYFMK